MKPTKKNLYFALLLIMLSAFLCVLSCGKTSSSGGCSDGTAPDGSSITGPSALGAPNIFGPSCYPAVGFILKDSGGNPLNGICVEVYSDASIALHSGLPNCSNVSANPNSSIITRTNDHGEVLVELLTGPTPTGGTHFVQVVSGSITAIASTAASK